MAKATSETDITGLKGHVHKIGIFERVFGRSCYSGPPPIHQHGTKIQTEILEFGRAPDICLAAAEAARHSVDIQMEREWNLISIHAPQYIYTVSGWLPQFNIDQISKRYMSRPLQVIIVPHSHIDPGWRATYEEYFEYVTKYTLNNAVEQLTKHDSWRFIWAEICFLAKWWKDTSEENKHNFKRLVNSSRLEIVTGGWVMSDEATVHYEAMLDQLIEGHQWMKTELGVLPETGWAIDPFGHSPTMAYLLQQAGIGAMVVQRVHYAIKKHLGIRKQLEFYWRQTWAASRDSDILCHIMPFLSYDISHSCGPDEFVCCQFDFAESKCKRGRRSMNTIRITDENVNKHAWELLEQYRKKSELYKCHVILVPHGDDLRYKLQSEWQDQMGNLEKLMAYMNAQPDMQVKVQFGTLRDYFETLKADEQHWTEDEGRIPTLSGDFFPYNDRDDQYWSGYFTTRPFYKYMARELQAKLRATEILFSLLAARLVFLRDEFGMAVLLTNKMTLDNVRQALALFQHHDAITGTSTKRVARDYAKQLFNAMTDIQSLLAKLVAGFMDSKEQSLNSDGAVLVLSEQRNDFAELPVAVNLDVSKKRSLVIFNPLTISRSDIVRVFVTSPFVEVLDEMGREVLSQINPVWIAESQISQELFELYFAVEISALGLVRYTIDRARKAIRSALPRITMYNAKIDGGTNEPFSILVSRQQEFEIENQHMAVTFYSCNGMMQYITKQGEITHEVRSKFMTYGTGSWKNPFRDKSGAYIFMPDGYAKPLPPYRPVIIVVQGRLMSQVRTIMPDVMQIVTLKHISGPLGAAVNVQNVVDIHHWNNTELVWRLETDILNDDGTFYTDLNGFQMHKRKLRKKFHIQGNFYPMSTMAYLENSKYRLSLLTASSHGVSSQMSGSLEVVLDRRLMQDDWRGLGEGITDNIPTSSSFMLVIEQRTAGTRESTAPAGFPSLLAHSLSSSLNNPIITFILQYSQSGFMFKKSHQLLAGSMSCDMHLINIRFLQHVHSRTEMLLILHRVGIDCGYGEHSMRCGSISGEVSLRNLLKGVDVKTITEMNITGVRKKNFSFPSLHDIHVSPMEIKTYKITFS